MPRTVRWGESYPTTLYDESGTALGDAANPMRVQAEGGTLVAGTLAATTTAQALGNQACRSVLVQADPANTANVLLGTSTSQPIVLQPSDKVLLSVSNVSQLYAKMATGTGNVFWLAET